MSTSMKINNIDWSNLECNEMTSCTMPLVQNHHFWSTKYQRIPFGWETPIMSGEI